MDNNLQDMIAKAVVDIIKQKEDNKGINNNILGIYNWKYIRIYI